MGKIIKNIVRKITDYLKEIVDDELKIMDAFYGFGYLEAKPWFSNLSAICLTPGPIGWTGVHLLCKEHKQWMKAQ